MLEPQWSQSAIGFAWSAIMEYKYIYLSLSFFTYYISVYDHYSIYNSGALLRPKMAIIGIIIVMRHEGYK